MTSRISVSGTTARRNRRAAWPVILAVLAILAGCAGSGPSRRAAHAELMSDAATDSLGLEEFTALAPDERADRRERAATWRQHAAIADEAWGRAESLETAAGLAPDDPHVWLDLAETAGWLGDPLRVDSALRNATAALRQLNEPASDLRITRSERDEIVERTSLLRSWYHYGRAEWHEGLSWARAALQVKPGSVQAQLIKGLLEAGAQQRAQAGISAEDLRRRTTYAPLAFWIDAMVDLAYGDHLLAFNQAHRVREPDEHAAECHRDRGRIAEVVGQWVLARNWYAESAASLHPLAARYRGRIDHPRLGGPLGVVEMPVWLSFDHYYLTGSLSAYTALVFSRFEAATTTADRSLWGGETVNAAGTLLRRGEDEPWAARARGLVFLDRARYDRARPDLERAERLFAEMDREDPAVIAGLGRLWLRQENHRQATPYLERAVVISPLDPAAWSDLGLVRVMAGDEEGAAAAFGRAIEIDPDAATAWYNRGLMRLHAGDLDGAAVDLGEAARLAPDNREIAQLLQRIRVMQRDGGSGE